MSLFRKPKKRMQMRVFANDEDDETNNGDGNSMDVDENIPQPPPAPIIRPKKEKSKDKFKPKQTLLSFGDEVEEDAEMFQVKKSSQSKKLMKMLDRERRGGDKKQSRGDGGKARGSGDSPRSDPIAELTDGKRNSGDGVSTSINSRKNDSYAKTKVTSIEGIVLTGRAALAAGRDGDMSGSDEEDDIRRNDDIIGRLHDVEGAERFRHAFVKHSGKSMRELLDSGAIPDAALIHAARKKRQQAREVGDFIPIQQSGSHSPPPISAPTAGAVSRERSGRGGGRLVREDGEGDASDEDPDRIDVRGVQPQHSKRERIKAATQNGSDLDSGGEEWETQQIRKAVTHSQIMAAQQETYYGNAYAMPTMQMADVELNPFAIAPEAISEQILSQEHLRSLAASEQASLTSQQLVEELKLRLSVMNEAQTGRQQELLSMQTELESLGGTKEGSAQRAPNLASRYQFYQKLRAYITDLIECLDEKMPALCALEQRAMTLHRRKAAFLIERRRADVRDQAQEVLQPTQGVKKDEEQSRRCAEREGRRLRRRRAREQRVMQNHREGESSDDEVPQLEAVSYQAIEDQIMSDAGLLFSDTLEEFSSLAGVLAKMEEWRQRDLPAYVEAYAGLCLPKLAGPFLRLKLLLWNPITDEEALDWEKMQWYRGLMLYGLTDSPESEQSLSEDPDIGLIPNIVMKIIIPKLTELIEGTWDPVSGSQCRRLAALLRRAATLPGPGPSSRHLTALAEAVVKRAQSALQHDVFIPILPKSVVEVSGVGKGGAAGFLRRQAALGVKLLGNLVALHGAIADSALLPLALSTLMQRYLLAAARCCPPVYGAELCWAMASCMPKAWLQRERDQPPVQQFLTCCQDILAQLTDNPLHMKAVDQLRSSIAILQGGSSG